MDRRSKYLVHVRKKMEFQIPMGQGCAGPWFVSKVRLSLADSIKTARLHTTVLAIYLYDEAAIHIGQ